MLNRPFNLACPVRRRSDARCPEYSRLHKPKAPVLQLRLYSIKNLDRQPLSGGVTTAPLLRIGQTKKICQNLVVVFVFFSAKMRLPTTPLHHTDASVSGTADRTLKNQHLSCLSLAEDASHDELFQVLRKCTAVANLEAVFNLVYKCAVAHPRCRSLSKGS